MIGPKGLKYTGFIGGYAGVVIRKLDEDQSKTLPVGLFFSKDFLVVVTALCLNKSPHFLQLYKHISKTVPKPFPALSLLLFLPFRPKHLG